MLSDDEIISLRASLGTYVKEGSSEIVVVGENNTNSIYDHNHFFKTWRIGYQTGTHSLTIVELYDLLGALIDDGYIFTSPLYPALQVHFRDGEPVTAMHMFLEGLESQAPKTKIETDPFEWLLENF